MSITHVRRRQQPPTALREALPPGLIPALDPVGWRDLTVQAKFSGTNLSGLRIAAIVPVQDEARTLAAVLQELERLPIGEVAVLVNGSSDQSVEIARTLGTRTVVYEESLGHDVGRAIGADLLQADIYLFVDADIVVPSRDLAPFLTAVAGGVDVALNDFSAVVGWGGDDVSVAKAFLNRVLGRPDLGIASMTAIPHALSRRAVEVITPARLAVPPLAHAVAVLEGLTVRAVHPIDVARTNRIHPLNSPLRSQRRLGETIIGDHVEAIEYVTRRRGNRAGFHDMRRRRDLIPKG